MTMDALIPAQMAKKAEAVGIAKVTTPTIKLLMLGILAGAFIAFGAVAATVISSGSLDFGVARLMSGLVFSLGLVLVVLAGAELFTGNNLIVMAVASGRVTLLQLLRNWVWVYVGNFVGAISVVILVFASQQYLQGGGAVGARMLAIGAAKTNLGFGAAIALGVLCNILVCLAVWLCMSARSAADKVVVILLPITTFVAAGFEHSVANMYFIPKALLVKNWAEPSFWRSIGGSTADYAHMTWTTFLVNNLLPVTIGNILGGAVLVGLVYWFIYLYKVDTHV